MLNDFAHSALTIVSFCLLPDKWIFSAILYLLSKRLSFKAGLPDENFNKKPNSAKKRPKKAKPTVCGIAIPLSQKTSKLQEYQIFSSNLRLILAWHCTGALMSPDFSWFVKLHTLGKMVPQFAYLSISSFLYESLSYSLLYLRSES